MKTITVRLTDNEAVALEQLAAIEGKSKNRYITGLIANAYAGFGAVTAGEILSTCTDDALADCAAELMGSGRLNQYDEEDILKVVRACDYSIEHFSGNGASTIEDIEDLRRETIELLMPATFITDLIDTP